MESFVDLNSIRLVACPRWHRSDPILSCHWPLTMETHASSRLGGYGQQILADCFFVDAWRSASPR